jgi:hypothetical protein
MPLSSLSSQSNPSLPPVSAVSNAIVQQHGGKIGVSSSGIRGEGSVFYVELPAFATYRPTSIPSSLGGRQALDPTRNSPQTLLEEVEGESSYHELPVKSTNRRVTKLKCAVVVDDSKMNRKMMTQVLSPYFQEILQVPPPSSPLPPPHGKP